MVSEIVIVLNKNENNVKYEKKVVVVSARFSIKLWVKKAIK